MIADPAARMAAPAFVTPLCSRFWAQVLTISARIRAQKQRCEAHTREVGDLRLSPHRFRKGVRTPRCCEPG
jgi:hypothetical protein